MAMTPVQRIKCGANQNACAARTERHLAASNDEAAIFPLVAVPNERNTVKQVLDAIVDALEISQRLHRSFFT